MPETARSGTQSVERAVHLLTELAMRGSSGWRLADVAAQCGLDRATAHRILAALVRARLVQRRDGDRHYLPGPLLFELGLSVPGLSPLQSACAAPLARLATRTSAVASFYLASGSEVVCAARAGASPVKGVLHEVGSRRPMMSTAGGVAILVAMPRDEARRIAASNARRLHRLGDPRVASLERMLERSQRVGYAINEGEVAPGLHAYGVAVRGADDRAFGSVTLAGRAEDFPPSRVAELLPLIEEEARAIAGAAARLLPRRSPSAAARGEPDRHQHDDRPGRRPVRSRAADG